MRCDVMRLAVESAYPLFHQYGCWTTSLHLVPDKTKQDKTMCIDRWGMTWMGCRGWYDLEFNVYCTVLYCTGWIWSDLGLLTYLIYLTLQYMSCVRSLLSVKVWIGVSVHFRAGLDYCRSFSPVQCSVLILIFRFRFRWSGFYSFFLFFGQSWSYQCYVLTSPDFSEKS